MCYSKDHLYTFMWNIIKRLSLLPTFLIVLLSVFFVSPKVYAQEQIGQGSIRICKAISDQNGNVADGSQAPGAKFTISGFVPSPVPLDGGPAGAIPTSTFTTPLTLNTKIFTESTGNDSQCVTYSGLSFGAYYYGQETSPSTGWQTPLYNDQFTSVVSKVTDVFPYDGRLFAADQSSVAQRNENADGSIVLNATRPNRTLVVVNTITTQGNTNNSGGDNSNNGGGSGGSSALVCNDTAPGSAPAITNVTTGNNSVTLTWTKAADPVSYYLIAYGTTPGNYQFGNPNVGNVTTYTINGLSGGQTYYFAVRAVNGCKPGPFSNEVSNIVPGGILGGPAVGFSSGVLGTNDPSKTSGIDISKAICSQCLWWPILLGDLLVLVGWYYYARRRNMRGIKRVGMGIAISTVAYIIFLIVNRGHVCITGGINFWIFSIPCKYFWVLDGLMLLFISLLIRNAKFGKTPKKSSKK